MDVSMRQRLVAILAADAVGYSRLMADDDIGTLASLDAAREVFRKQIAASGGRVVDTAGDSVLAAFPSAHGAVVAALGVQRELEAAAPSMRFRIGIHLGDVIEKADGSVYGDGVNVAARLQALARPGGVIVSQAVLDVAGRRLALATADLGLQTVKNISQPVHAHAVGSSGAALEAPAAAPLPELPRPRTRFFGRLKEKADAAKLLREGGLLTLTGIGGSGKTRLAIELARERRAEGRDTWFVDLAPVGDGRDIVTTIGTVLGVRALRDQPTESAIVDRLRDRGALLVLDNCEHVVDVAAQLVEAMLEACDDLSVLVTSREPLGVPGEHVRPLRSLALVPADDVQALAQCDAVRLFTDRAQLTAPAFAVDADNAGAVHEICRRLDGIPLAIELAAARLSLLTPEQIRVRLDDRFRLLTGGRRALPRHQTLATVIRWSFEQLTPGEQRLLLRLSVFSGGWNLAGATAVAACPELDVLDILSALADKALIAVDSDEAEARYTILETVRQYAQERLDEGNDANDARAAHLAFFAGRAEAIVDGDSMRERWFAPLRIDHDNLVAALRFAAEAGAGADGLRIAGALRRYWEASGQYELGARLTEAVLDATAGDALVPARLNALHAASRIALWTGRYERQRELAMEGLSLARRLERARDEFNALIQLASAALALDDADLAWRTVGELEQLALRLGPFQVRTAAHMRAEVLRGVGRNEEAELLYRENLEVARAAQQPRSILNDCVNLAFVALARRNVEAGRSWLRECMTLLQQNAWGVDGRAHVVEIISGLHVLAGDAEGAARLHGAVRAFEQRIGLRLEPLDERLIAGLLQEARTAIGTEAFDRAAAEGRAWNAEAMLATACYWLSLS